MPGSDPGYRLSPLARTDLEDIWRYTFKNCSLEQADRYHGTIMTAIGALADGSVPGSRADVREGYFKLSVGSHVLFYRKTDTTLEIMRILHQRMDVGRHL